MHPPILEAIARPDTVQADVVIRERIHQVSDESSAKLLR